MCIYIYAYMYTYIHIMYMILCTMHVLYIYIYIYIYVYIYIYRGLLHRPDRALEDVHVELLEAGARERISYYSEGYFVISYYSVG